MDRPFTVGALLSRTFSVWARNLLPIVALTLAIYSPLIAWTLLAPVSRPGDLGGRIPDMLSSLLGLILTGAVTYLVLQRLRGERASLGRTLGAAAERFFAIFATSFWESLATGVGFLLLVVPGLVVTTLFFVAVPVTVVERPGAFASLGRSAELTKGHRWHVFAAALVTWLLVFAAAIAPGLLAGVLLGGAASADGSEGLAQRLASHLAAALAGSIASVASAVAYHDLRVAKEGVATADLVKVFE